MLQAISNFFTHKVFDAMSINYHGSIINYHSPDSYFLKHQKSRELQLIQLMITLFSIHYMANFYNQILSVLAQKGDCMIFCFSLQSH